jgi:apolipoprotein D and lipocalin family protein
MIALVLSLALAQTADTVPLDVDRYMGTWYEIARFDSFYQRGCVASSAEYSRQGSDVKIINRCFDGSLEGKQKIVEGKAWVPDAKEPGKLRVQFFWPFSGPYWVIDIADDYSWALIGHPEKKSCWVFSRTPAMDDTLYQTLIGKLKARGYDTTRLIKPVQKT